MAFLLTFSGGGSATYKDAVRVASTANLALSGSTPLTIDGVTLADKERVLLKDQTTQSQNGIYEVSISGGSYSLARAKDADTDKEVLPGMIVPVAEGTLHADKIYQLLTNAPIVVGTTALVFSDVLIGLANKADRNLANLTSPTALNQVLRGQDGTVSAPAYSFISNTDTGIYRSSANTIGFTANGILQATITTSSVLALKAYSGVNPIINFEAAAFSNYGRLQYGGQDRVRLYDSTTGGDVEIRTALRVIGDLRLTNTGSASQNNLGVAYGGSNSVIYGIPTVNLGLIKISVLPNQANNTPVSGGALSTKGSSFASQWDSIVTNDTSTVTANYGPTGFPGGYTIAVLTGPGDYLKFSKVGQPDLVAKIVSKSSSGWPTTTFTMDTSIPAAYSGGNITVFIPPFVVQKEGGGQVLEVDYNGNLTINSGLKIKSAHAQVGTANVITVAVSDYYIGVDCSANAKTIALPAAATAGAGKQYVFKDESGNAATNNITIDPNGAELIDGAANYVMAVNRESVTVVCDGTGWQII